jgi:hypothetical protein
MHTKNNNSSMKTVVETFIIEETQDLIYDNEKLSQWNQYVQELGLSGQAKIKVEGKSPIPFLHMNQALIAVFETLCPKKFDIEKYDRTPIPVEILSLVALAKQENYFTKIEVWANEKDPDPVVIGLLPGEDHNKSEWYPHYWERYLIGRWADVKQSLEQLTEKAKKIFKQNIISTAESSIRTYKRQIEDADATVSAKFGFNTEEGLF